MKNLVFIEHADGKVKKASLEIISVAREYGDVSALVVGEIDSEILSKYGASKIVNVEQNILEPYASGAYAKVIVDCVNQEDPDLIFFSASRIGMELAPLVAANLKISMASDCIGFSVDNGTVKIDRPVYAGKSFISVAYNRMPMIVTIRPNSFEAKENPVSAESVSLSANVEPNDIASRVKEVIASISKRVDLTEANIIVSGGRGVGGAEGFAPIELLADEMSAAVGASRAAVDAGWRDHTDQVGQTGKTVTPQLYIACGISGAIQHLAGMSGTKTIVAINKDPDAPIFKIADYGIVGDLFEVLPILAEEIKKIRS